MSYLSNFIFVNLTDRINCSPVIKIRNICVFQFLKAFWLMFCQRPNWQLFHKEDPHKSPALWIPQFYIFDLELHCSSLQGSHGLVDSLSRQNIFRNKFWKALFLEIFAAKPSSSSLASGQQVLGKYENNKMRTFHQLALSFSRNSIRVLLKSFDRNLSFNITSRNKQIALI